jgi:CheY-like chemotaxis protein
MKAATILIVDDQQQVLRMAEVMLRAAGYEVHAASTRLPLTRGCDATNQANRLYATR